MTTKTMKIIAIDPGNFESAFLVWDGQRILQMGISPNMEVLGIMPDWLPSANRLAIEMIASYGMAVGKEVFDTCIWIGRFIQQWHPRPYQLVYRREIKQHHCMSQRATDSNIRMALIDKYGDVGTKKNPGMTYGLKKHLWSAFAIATYISESDAIKAQQPALLP